MIKELSKQEFDKLVTKYPATSFLGGTSMLENIGATIYLYDGKSVLISDDEIEAIQYAKACMKLEAESFLEDY